MSEVRLISIAIIPSPRLNVFQPRALCELLGELCTTPRWQIKNDLTGK